MRWRRIGNECSGATSLDKSLKLQSFWFSSY